MDRSSNIVTFTVLGSNGEFSTQEFTERKNHAKTKKGGWVSMYKNGYDEVFLALNSRLEKEIMLKVRDSFTRTKSDVCISQKKMAEDLNTTRPTVNRVFKKLLDLEFIARLDKGVYRLNPFFVIPYQADGLKLQEEWEELYSKD